MDGSILSPQAYFIGDSKRNLFDGLGKLRSVSFRSLFVFWATTSALYMVEVAGSCAGPKGSDQGSAKGFPAATSTGVPARVILTPSGGLVINTPGVVIEGLDIRGMVTINADNVTLKNSTVSGASWAVINITSGVTGTVIENCEINGMNAEGVRGISGQGTFLRNNIHNVEDGIYVLQRTVATGSTLVQDNYIHDLKSDWSGPHYDGVAIDGGANVTIRHNTIINPNSQTSAVMIDNYFGPISNITVENNLLVGGAYTIFVDGQFGGGSVTDVKITNNRLGKGQFGYIANTKTSPVLMGNVDSITGRLLPGQKSGNPPSP